MQHWLVKSEPESYSWDDFVKLGKDHWDGVRNYAARNHMRSMREGDLVLFYHSGKSKEVVGLAKVVSEHYQDPTTDDERWSVVDLVPLEPLKRSVSLKEIKNESKLQNMALIKQSRLSVQPVQKEEFDHILGMSQRFQ